MNREPEPNDESPSGDFPESQVAALLSCALEPVAPGDDAKARLFSAIDAGAKYAPFCADLAEHFDLSRERVLELLSCIDEPGAWTQGIHPIQGFLHFRPGPRFASLHGGFTRMESGAGFPLHRHRDREVTCVLEGALRDGDGNRYGPGEAIDMPPGSQHTLRVDGDGPALLALLHGGIEMIGQ
jgi:hypothetical protein